MKKILVIGDIIADSYRECAFKKMCPDAPSVKAVVEMNNDLRPGGAANVAVNIAALTENVAISLIGEIDIPTARSVKQLSKNKVNLSYCDMTGEVLLKERILIHGQMAIRVDNKSLVSPFASESIENSLKRYLANNNPDLVVVSDYAAGSINDASLEILLSMRERLLVDTKMTDLSIFADGGKKTKLIKLNLDEWKNVIKTEASPERFFSSMILTKGDRGAELVTREDHDGWSITRQLVVQPHSVQAVDVCGCGDTFMAGLASSLLVNDDYFTALQFANAAAATVVSKPRTAVADLDLTLKLLGRDAV